MSPGEYLESALQPVKGAGRSVEAKNAVSSTLMARPAESRVPLLAQPHSPRGLGCAVDCLQCHALSVHASLHMAAS